MPYLNTDEVESALSVATSAPYSAFTQLITLPNLTWELRQCHAIKIANGSNPGRPGVYFLGGIHAREWGSSDILVNFIEQVEQAYLNNTSLTFASKSFSASDIQNIVNKLDIIVFPQANPDGRNYSINTDAIWRKNRRVQAPNSAACPGVDINRNYNFLWDYQLYFSHFAPISDSTDPCDFDVYNGPAAFSEPETKNAAWIFDTFPNIGFFIDLHSYGKHILYNWGDDEDQSTNASMNFQNPAYNGQRGLAADSYNEYIPSSDLTFANYLANTFRDGIQALRGTVYTVKSSYSLYPTAGTSADYAYSRNFVDVNKRKVVGYVLEWGTEFQPTYSEMQNIIQEITCGLLTFCLAVCRSKSGGNDFWVMKYDPSSHNWNHLSPMAGHPLQADLDCSSLPYPAKFVVAGDYDNDGKTEIAIGIDAGQSGGNDFWVMKYDPSSHNWNHLSPMAGHPLQADLDCSSLPYPAKFVVAGDYDNDGKTEIAIGIDAGQSGGNDFWVMKYDPSSHNWNHLSPMAGHPLQADLDCSSLPYPAKFVVAGDYDNDGKTEIAIGIDAGQSGGNDFWVMKYDPSSHNWNHLSPMAGHPLQADLDCSSLPYPAKFVVAGDYDNDGKTEIAIGIDAGQSGGNDFWVMKYDPSSHNWNHLSPMAGHPLQADLDCSSLPYPAKFVVAGDYDNDGKTEIAIGIDAGQSGGNDFWVMKYDPSSHNWNHLSPMAGHPLQADLDCSSLPYPAKFVVAGDYDNDGKTEIAIGIDAGQSGGNDFWVMKYDPSSHNWNHLSPMAGHPLQADLDCSSLPYPAKFVVAGDYDNDGKTEIAIGIDAA